MKKKALIAMSGVDSSVAAVLMKEKDMTLLG